MLKKLTPGYWVNLACLVILVGGLLAGIYWFYNRSDSDQPDPDKSQTTEPSEVTQVVFGDKSVKTEPATPLATDPANLSITFSEYDLEQSRLTVGVTAGNLSLAGCSWQLVDSNNQTLSPVKQTTFGPDPVQAGCPRANLKTTKPPIEPGWRLEVIGQNDQGQSLKECWFRLVDLQIIDDLKWTSDQNGCNGNI